MTQDPLIPLLSPDQRPKDHSLSFSKWLELNMLLEAGELSHLLDTLGDYFLISPYNTCPQTPHLVSKEYFLKQYEHYLDALKSGDTAALLKFNALQLQIMLVPTLDRIFIYQINPQKSVVVFGAPYIKVAPIGLQCSQVDHELRVATLSSDLIAWGLLFRVRRLAKRLAHLKAR